MKNVNKLPVSAGSRKREARGLTHMLNNVLNLDKVSGDSSPFVSLIDRILIITPLGREKFSGKLKEIRDKYLVLEQRNGAMAVIRVDAILSAFEVRKG